MPGPYPIPAVEKPTAPNPSLFGLPVGYTAPAPPAPKPVTPPSTPAIPPPVGTGQNPQPLPMNGLQLPINQQFYQFNPYSMPAAQQGQQQGLANPNAISAAAVVPRNALVPVNSLHNPATQAFSAPNAKWNGFDATMAAQNAGFAPATDVNMRLGQMMGPQRILPDVNKGNLGHMLLGAMMTAAPAVVGALGSAFGPHSVSSTSNSTGGTATSNSTGGTGGSANVGGVHPQQQPANLVPVNQYNYPSMGMQAVPWNGMGWNTGGSITFGGPVAGYGGGGGGGGGDPSLSDPSLSDPGTPYFGTNSVGSNTPGQFYAGTSGAYNGGNYMGPQTASPGSYANTQGASFGPIGTPSYFGGGPAFDPNSNGAVGALSAPGSNTVPQSFGTPSLFGGGYTPINPGQYAPGESYQYNNEAPGYQAPFTGSNPGYGYEYGNPFSIQDYYSDTLGFSSPLGAATWNPSTYSYFGGTIQPQSATAQLAPAGYFNNR